MWSRKELKSRAKEVLKKSYWKALIVSLVLVFIGGNSGGSSSSSSFTWNMTDTSEYGLEVNPAVILIMLFVGLIIFAIVVGLRIFLGYPLEVGGRRYFVQSTKENFNMNNLGYAFEKGIYFDVIKSMLWKGFLNFLWFLLLIIPGIVKAYSYSMVPYILGNNPNIGYKRGLELSMKMTKGHKLDMFVLDLSFLGWYLLGALAFGIGTIFVLPYHNATKGELYIELRKYALANNLTSYDELRLNDPDEGEMA